MELRLYDTLSREKRPFRPLDPARVRMYVCGPTVYDFAHIGNARPVIVFDVLFRLLRHLYGAEHVTYVRNITDVDDKINARAAEEYPGLPLNEAIRTVTEKTEQQFHDDVDALGCLRPTIEPRATEHIDEMRALIERLVAAGNAYVAEDHVLFSVPSMPDYGKLSRRPLDEMIAGARVDVAPYKRDPMDFVLWKPSKPGEPAWPSPCRHRDARPARLAHRMLGHVVEASGRDLRHPWRRHRSRVSPPRERDRAIALRLSYAGDGELLDAQRLPAGRRREDVRRAWGISSPSGSCLAIGLDEVARCGSIAMLRTHYRQPIDWTLKRLQEEPSRLSMAGTGSLGDQAHIDPKSISRQPLLDQLLCDDLNTPQHSLSHRFSSIGRQIEREALPKSPQIR